MVKRLFDLIAALALLILCMPLLFLAAIGIKSDSPGPIFYYAIRAGRNGKPFAMLKFRSMDVSDGEGSEITAPNDARVFGFGKFIRKTKIDELPQLINILRGHMSVVGPRPEAVNLVRDHYTDWMRETLRVRPGITSPGAIFSYTHGALLLDDDNPEESYIENMLAPKLAIELAYIERASLLRDIGLMIRTVWTIFLMAIGRTEFSLPPEVRSAQKWYDFQNLRLRMP